MQYVPLAPRGAAARVSRLCLGTMGFGSKEWRPWVVGEAECRAVVRRALDLGINFVDTADVYSLGKSEELVGRALEGRREEVVLATKVFNALGPRPNDRGLGRKHVLHGLAQSLQRLETPYVDLYQTHRWDDHVDYEEALSTLDGAVRDGRVRYLGASTMFAWQFAKALFLQERRGWHRFVTMQPHYNLVYREEEREMLPLCRDQGVGVIPWSPLARGFLAHAGDGARTVRAGDDEGREQFYGGGGTEGVLAGLREVAKEKGATPAQVALAWLLHQPWVTAPILGATKVEHVEEAVGALDLRLSAHDLARLEQPYQPRGLAGFYRSPVKPEHLAPGERAIMARR